MSIKQIKIGDQVRFMNEVGGGRITAILSKDLVSVETTDGFEIPTYLKNLVIIESGHAGSPANSASGRSRQETIQDKTSTSATSANPQLHYPEVPKSNGFREKNQHKGNDFPEFIFAALPENPGNPTAGKILLYLVNDCNFTLIYHFATKMGEQYTTIDAGMLEPNTKVELDALEPKAIGELPGYCFQLLYFRKLSTQLHEPVQKEIRIAPVKFFKASSFVKNNYFATPAMLIKLEEHPLKAELERLSENDFHQISQSKEPKKAAILNFPKNDLVEVDLHIHQLLDDTRGLSNADMLKLQLETFRKEMDQAISNGVKKIVFIHGVGDGVLKNELRRELTRKYGRYPFQDASFREYGFGATMAVLKK